MMMRAAIGLVALGCLTACGSGSGDGVGGVSASEASALNDAAAMLDARTGQAQAADAGLNPAALSATRANRRRVTPDANATANAATPSHP